MKQALYTTLTVQQSQTETFTGAFLVPQNVNPQQPHINTTPAVRNPKTNAISTVEQSQANL